VATGTKRPPYEAYAGIMGTFMAGLGATGALARALNREPQCRSPLDLFVLSAATFKASRTMMPSRPARAFSASSATTGCSRWFHGKRGPKASLA